MRVLYIGQFGAGGTSRMRGEILKELLTPQSFEVIDLDVPLHRPSKLVRSIGWRFTAGPLIGQVNRYIQENLQGHYDLIWVDKGNFIRPEVIRDMEAGLKVHYTPDTGIVYNQSRLFFQSIPFYNYCITTKSFELDAYREKGARGLLYCTQGYDARLHRPSTPFEKKNGAVFIGLNEPAKEAVVAQLLEAKIKVTLAGAGWEKFAHNHRHDSCLDYKGTGVFGEAYSRLLSEAQLGLGLLSKRFPEKHTTRTIEIPACGTALVSERNEDTSSIFEEDEALLFDDTAELMDKVKRALGDEKYLRSITEKGYHKISSGPFDYASLLRSLLKEMLVIK